MALFELLVVLAEHLHVGHRQALVAELQIGQLQCAQVVHRLEQAAFLLQTSADEIAAIAGAVGYDSPSRFTTAFREMYGEVPTEYRRRMQEKQPETIDQPAD